ncbi:hypothetical protein [uncultured Methanofollis sp.]|uniref:hypothetical protein n=1 Tax=uncultured Methanofollis sp. TaxID=262500 RepID=UPI0026025363|nr:hypothetical protein [uncultured Methanofollis sp.]
MNLIATAVQRLEEIMKDAGCEEGVVSLAQNPKLPLCPYPRGVCTEACFGDRHGHVVTADPIRACTKVSFMFGAPLRSPVERTAACAIINAVTGFFCINRKTNACDGVHHAPCLEKLLAEVEGKRVAVVGEAKGLPDALGAALVSDPADADILLVTGPGLVSDEGLAAIEAAPGTKRVIFLGPSTAGVALLQKVEHWCPYGH